MILKKRFFIYTLGFISRQCPNFTWMTFLTLASFASWRLRIFKTMKPWFFFFFYCPLAFYLGNKKYFAWKSPSLYHLPNLLTTFSILHVTEGDSVAFCHCIKRSPLSLGFNNMSLTSSWALTGNVSKFQISTYSFFKSILSFTSILFKVLPYSHHYLVQMTF